MKNFSLYALLTLLSVLVSFSSKSQVTSSFTPAYTSGCAPLVDSFNNTSTGPITGYFWDFGTGTTSVLKNPSTSFTTPGTYTVKLTVYGTGGPVTSSKAITVYPPPTVSFHASATTVCPGTPVTYTSTTVGGTPGPISYTWSFGDGTVSTATTPVHVYSVSGYYNVTLFAINSMGCAESLTVAKYIHVLAPPVPNFTASSVLVCKAPGTVTFTDISTGTPPLTYIWDFGDGSGPSTLKNPTHTYAASGTYTVKLTVTDGNGCTATIVKPAYVTISGIKANFAYPKIACVNSLITFTNTSTTHSSSYWDYGDGGSGTGDPGTHTYTGTGTFSVRLIIFDGTCYDTVTKPITIIAGPVVSISQVPLQPCPPPVGITFTATAPPGIGITWTFGDGGTGTGSPITHLYAWRGVYTITMTGTDPSTGCTTTALLRDTLYDMVHSIVASPVKGCRPLTVNFADTPYTYEPDTTKPKHFYPYGVTSYSWTFGDGGTSTASRPLHIYTAVGTYRASVTVVTSNGCAYTDTIQILVGDPPVVTLTALPTHVCYGHPITYVSTIVKGPVDNYDWQFGDGSFFSTTGGIITYIDLVPGIFTVTLTPSYHGCYGPPVNITVIVDSPKSIPKDSIACSPRNRVFFKDLSLGDDSHLWVFGDGTTSTLANPVHDYPSSTTYTVYLATYNIASGCRDTASFTVDLTYPSPDFTVSSPFICKDAVDTFTATITGGTAVSYYWDGGGTFPFVPSYGRSYGIIGPIITDTFHIAGIYNIRLIVTDQNGCFDTVIKPGIVSVGDPKVNFTATPAAGCAPLSVTFMDVSYDVPGFTLSQYFWSFGDGGSSTVTSGGVVHTFTVAGAFKTQEIVVDNYGCTDSASLSLVTVWKPHADFSSYQYPCVGDGVNFLNTSTGAVSYFWNFGDGSTSTAFSPWHTYTTAGTYTVYLAVTDVHGCRDTDVLVNYITSTKVIASFTMSDTFAVCPPLTVNFTNTSIGAGTYNWDLGNGAVSTLPNPSNMYIDSGFYYVKLIASNSYGCSDTAIQRVVIYGYAGALSYTPLTGCVPLLVHFKAKITNVSSIIWDFSDGVTSSPSLTDTIDHLYTVAGAYVPKLILSDKTGCQNSSPGLDTIKVDEMYAGFTTVPSPVCINVPILYKDTSHSYFSTLTYNFWTFSNGDTSTGNMIPAVYPVAGAYPVSLFVIDGWGCEDSLKTSVMVYPPPVITVSPDTIVCLTDAATLTGYGGVSYTWVPAGTLSCANCNPTLASPAVITSYTVTGTDIHGCVNTDSVTVFLKTLTVSHATGDTDICRNTVVQLHDSGGTTYFWQPSGGLSDPRIANPLAYPTVTTDYRVIARLGSCIPDTGYVLVTIHDVPSVDAGPDQRVLEGTLTQLHATGTQIDKISWGESPTLSCDSCFSPVASNTVTTTYVVVASTLFGCKDTDSVTIRIYCGNGQIFMPNTFTPNGDGENDVYYPRGKGISIIKSFRIYNRWGQLLFERSDIRMNDAGNAWDGSYLGGEPRPDVYVWVVDAVCESGEPINLKGDVTIIR